MVGVSNMSQRILLKNAQIVTLDNDNNVYTDYCIGIVGKTINYVGVYLPEVEINYQKVIDCKGKTIMPGFVNAHNHAAMTVFRNYADDMKLMDWLFNKIFPLEDKLTGEGAYWASMLAIVEMIKSGTTTFADMYFFMDQTAEAIGQSGIRAAISRGLQGDSESGIDYRLKENLDLFKEYNNGFEGRLKVNLGPHSVYTCTADYLKKVAGFAEQYNIPMQIHLSETADEVANCIEKYKKSPVKLLDEIGMLNNRLVAAHCVMVDDEDIYLLAQNNVNVVHNPGSNMKLASGIAPIEKMMKKGINIALGTDGASSNNNLDMLEEVRLAALLQKYINNDPTSLPVDTVLKMATSNGAKSLGFENTGYISVGAVADLIIINTEKAQYYPKYNIKSAIVYSGNSSDVETVIIDGKIVMEKNKILTLDEERILFEVQRISEQITN